MAPSQAHDDSPTRVVELAVNLDDVSGELVGAAIGRMMSAGALDAWATAITMKKGRPGVCLSVLCREDQQHVIARQLLKDTGSFGVRFRAWDRVVLERTWHQRDTRLGMVKLKAGSLDGRIITVKAEFDDLLALAEQQGVALQEALRVADDAAEALLAELQEAVDHA